MSEPPTNTEETKKQNPLPTGGGIEGRGRSGSQRKRSSSVLKEGAPPAGERKTEDKEDGGSATGAGGAGGGKGKQQQSKKEGDAQPPQPQKKKQPPAHGKTPADRQLDNPKMRADAEKKKILKLAPVTKQVPLFSHLPQYERGSSLSLRVGFSASEKIHPAIIQLGLKYANGDIIGSDARCVAMLTAFKEVIRDYVTPPSVSLHRDLGSALNPQIQFLVDCRPLSVTMGKAINYLKKQITAAPSDKGEEEAKQFLFRRIDDFVQERITDAVATICDYAVNKILDGDVILTHASSYVVERILKAAHDKGRQFRVVVVDSRPKKEGKALLRRLIAHGIKCTYILTNAISYIMKQVSKVMVGAYTLLNNGSVISRVGTAMVAMTAYAYHVPVLICCETYKFGDRVQIDSICFNELGDPGEVLLSSGNTPAHAAEGLLRKDDWININSLRVLNLMYDVTPMEFVTAVITEVGMIPPTSVPVVVREYFKEL